VLGAIRTDRGKEFFNKTFKRMLESRRCAPRKRACTPSTQNGVRERMNRTLPNMTRCMLHAAGLHLSWWGDALLHAVYVHNRTSQAHFSQKMTPMEAWTGRPPNINLGSSIWVSCPRTYPNRRKAEVSDKFSDAPPPMHSPWCRACIQKLALLLSPDANHDCVSGCGLR